MKLPTVRAWFSDEVANILESVAVANADVSSAINTPEMALYRRGFDAALRSVALAFGVDEPTTCRRVQR